MSCTSCQSQCSCNGTIKSRRCECVAVAKKGLAIRDTAVCADNGLFNPSHYANKYLNNVDVYGSGLDKTSLDQLRYFDANTSRFRSSPTYSLPGFISYSN